MRNAPAEMDEMKPEFFLCGGMRAKPSFEILVGSLPVLPVGGSGFNSAGFGAEIINIKWLQNKSWFAFGKGEIIQNKFSIFGKVERLVKSAFFGKFSAI